MKIKEYVEKIVMTGNQETMRELSEMLEEAIIKLKVHDHKCYEKYKLKLYELANGKVLTTEMAKEWVECMKPIGEHWTMEETTSVLNRLNYMLNPTEFYVVMNMMYNDYNDIVADNDELTIKLTKDWLRDVDGVEHKLYEYWKHIKNKD